MRGKAQRTLGSMQISGSQLVVGRITALNWHVFA